MNPNATLRQLRDMALNLRSVYAESYDEFSDEEKFLDAFESLDEWLSNGGSLPTPWARR